MFEPVDVNLALHRDAAVALSGNEPRAEVENLGGNAIKFTLKGGLLEVRACAGAERLVCEVRDNGPGVTPEDLPPLLKAVYTIEHEQYPFCRRHRVGAGNFQGAH